MPEGAGLGIDSGILIGVCVWGGWYMCACFCVCLRGRVKESYNIMVAVLMRTCQCCYIYINLVDPFKIMSNECAEGKRA